MADVWEGRGFIFQYMKYVKLLLYIEKKRTVITLYNIGY
jgi:hypothetical protein